MVEGGFANKTIAKSPLQAEVLAFMKGLKFMQQIQESYMRSIQQKTIDLVCKSDSWMVVESILGREEAHWVVRNIVNEGKWNLASLHQVKPAHCQRERNRAADWVAKAH